MPDGLDQTNPPKSNARTQNNPATNSLTRHPPEHSRSVQLQVLEPRIKATHDQAARLKSGKRKENCCTRKVRNGRRMGFDEGEIFRFFLLLFFFFSIFSCSADYTNPCRLSSSYARRVMTLPCLSSTSSCKSCRPVRSSGCNNLIFSHSTLASWILTMLTKALMLGIPNERNPCA
jgi:hypothetical protein